MDFVQGVDFPPCTLVIQLGNPGNMHRTLQRGGRGGRNPDTLCRVLILTQRLSAGNEEDDSAEEAVGDAATDEPSDDTGKEDASTMREFLTTTECLWQFILDLYACPQPREGKCYSYIFYIY